MPQTRASARAADFRSTQRERLLAGMLAAVNADGYAGATVANVIARAGVARATFYQQFTDKDDCFLAVYRDISARLLEQVAKDVSRSSPERAVHAVIGQLCEHAEANPVQARFLVSDALAGGARALQERGRAIGQIAGEIHAARATEYAQTPAPDLPTRAVIGATQWLIAQRMRRGEHQHTQLAHELEQWLTCYERPLGRHRWSTLSPGPLPAQRLYRSEPLASELAQRRRGRILLAAAHSALRNGYGASSLRAIMARAGLRKADFYEHFAEKRQAFLALHELAFQQSMGVGGTAYFSEKQWPERVWRCVLATSQFHAAHPAIAHVGLVETHALGLPAIQRVEESRGAFAILLLADNQKTSPVLTATAAEAIGATIFEIAHDRVRHNQAKDLSRYTYHATYVALAPFLGVHGADRLVQRKLKDAGRGPQ